MRSVDRFRLVKIIRNPIGYFADRIADCLHGAATDDETLIRLVVSRSEVWRPF